MIVPVLADSEATKDHSLQDALQTWTLSGLLRIVPFLDFSIIQYNMAHAFLDYYIEADDNIPQILKERAAHEDGNFGTFQRYWRTVCTAGLR